MQYRIEVSHRPGCKDPDGVGALSEIRDLGIEKAEWVRTVDVYLVTGELDDGQIDTLARELFHDPVVQEYRLCDGQQMGWDWAQKSDVHTIEVSRKPGVMDPVQYSALKGASDLGLEHAVESVRTARVYAIKGALEEDELERIASKILANQTIEEVRIDEPHVEYPASSLGYEFELEHVPIREADDDELMRISREGMLSLTLREMKTIQERYRELDRDPTDLELEILAQTWSEHCVHKTLKGHVTYEGPVPQTWHDHVDEDGRLVIDNLMKQTIIRATEELDKPWCVSVFKDNAGIVEFNEDWHACFKVETHNHPSAIEPYGGANTGIGGVIRDPLGTGLGARPVLNTDVFCFGPPDMDEQEVPEGALHPRRVMKGVVAGVRDYGNRMGIPTANGAVYFDERYTGNPLVYCGNVGLIPRGKVEKAPRPGDLVVVVGGRTGRDGIHGATFSSAQLTSDSEELSSGAVQIGNPITEKKVVDTLQEARDRDLYDCITDCGAGGLSSAVGEMGADIGVRAELSDVPLKYEGLSYTEIWISEAQERMVLSVPPENRDEIMEVFEAENVEATVIGEFTGDEKLTVTYEGNTVAEMDMHFLHEGLPRFIEEARWQPPTHPDPLLDDDCPSSPKQTREAFHRVRTQEPDPGDCLRNILAAPNVRSKEWIIRQYDHEVQGASVLKPLVGEQNDGPGDATVFAPVLGSRRGLAVACGMNPKYGDIDTYHSAAAAIDEALRNITAVGGSIRKTSILDNFCWGNTRRPEQLGTLVRAALACYDYATAFEVPFTSGKDSLHNEFDTGEETISIPPTLLISALCVVDDVTGSVSMDLKEPGNLLYQVGPTRAELGGSHYLDLFGLTGRTVPRVQADLARRTMLTVSDAARRGLVRSCHDISEGGLAVAAAEMAFSGEVGLDIDLENVPYRDNPDWRRDDILLFGESQSRFLVEVAPEDSREFEDLFEDIPCGRVGELMEDATLHVRGLEDSIIVEESLADLKSRWQTPFAGTHSE